MSLNFQPLPFLSNRHLQTVLGTVWREVTRPLVPRQQSVLLPDGDQLVLHDSRPPCWKSGDRIALLVHGLGGSHRSGYMERLTGLLVPHGVRVVRIDLRGAGQGAGLARRTYHGGCSEDLRAAIEAIHGWSPASPIAVLGFSLGGNIALKLAGEAAARPVPGLERVAAVSPPIDLLRCAELIALRRNRFYEGHFVRHLVAQVRRLQRWFPEARSVRFPRQLTLRQFDEIWTAPRSGFAHALDYYQRASSRPLIAHIAVPAFILTARDDPFIAVEPFETLAVSPSVEVHITQCGGHLGFLGWDGAGGIRWAEHCVVRWVAQAGGRAEYSPPV